MIKFFRQIRKSLIMEDPSKSKLSTSTKANKVRSISSKYLKYAIGEILLVVIGILIALNINNWNEANKIKAQEIKIYKEIMSDLDLTLEEVKKDMDDHETAILRNKAFLEHLVDRRPYSDSLILLMSSVDIDFQVYPKTSGFNALNSIGLDLLSNDSLRIEITNLYQLYLQRVVNAGWRETPSEDIKQLMGPYLLKHLVIDTTITNRRIIKYGSDSILVHGTKIRDYEYLMSDDEFQKQLNFSIINRATKIVKHFLVIKRINHATIAIEEELSRLEN